MHKLPGGTHKVRTDLDLEEVISQAYPVDLAAILFPQIKIETRNKRHGHCMFLCHEIESQAIRDVLDWAHDCIRAGKVVGLKWMRFKAYSRLVRLRELGVMMEMWSLVEVVDGYLRGCDLD